MFYNQNGVPKVKLVIDRELFSHSFDAACMVVNSKAPKAVLTKVHCKADDEVFLTATDTEVSIRVRVSGCEIERPGKVLLDAGKLRSILRESSDENLTIEADDSKVYIKGQSSRFQLGTEDANTFPVPNFSSGGDELAVKGEVLKRALSLTMFATDTDSSRYALGGVALQADDGGAFCVATDGRRLSVVTLPNLTGKCNGVVPVRAVNAVSRVLGGDEVTIRSTHNAILFESDGLVMESALLEGRYPNWKAVLPKYASPKNVEVMAGSLASALRQAAITSDHESRGVLFSFEDGVLSLQARTKDVGESQIQVPITYSDEALSILVDSRYVMDWLTRVDPASLVVINFETETQPMLLNVEGCQYVVMPMAKQV